MLASSARPWACFQMSPCRRDTFQPILRNILATLGIILLTGTALLGIHPTTQQTEFFESKVRPLLAKNCYQCHTEQAEILYSNLRVDGRAALLNGGVRGSAIVPGDPGSSQLIQAVRYEKLKMPPAGRLSEDQIEALVKWVEMGAPWPDLEVARTVTTSNGQTNLAANQSHWAWKPVQKASPPPVRNKTWPADPIDNFILNKLETEGLNPSSDADRYTLLRRVLLSISSVSPRSPKTSSRSSDTIPNSPLRRSLTGF